MNRNKFLIIIVAGILALGGIVIFNSCITEKTNKIYPNKITTRYDDTAEKPDAMKAYLDVSGSMRGYFSKGSDGRFVTAVSNAGADTNVWMSNIDKPIKGLLSLEALNTSFKAGDSRFEKMIATIREDSKLGESENLALLFTDGIISCSKAETDKDPKITLKSFGQLKNLIVTSLQGSNLAVALLQLESKFAGTYWKYDNDTERNLVIENRPFYVLAIGKPQQIRYFLANNKMDVKNQLAWGIYETEINDKIELVKKDKKDKNGKVQGNSKYAFTPQPLKSWDGDWFIGKKDSTISFSLPVPQYIGKLGKDYLLENIVVELNGKTITEKVKLNLKDIEKDGTIDHIILSWNPNPAKQPNAPLASQNDLVLKVVKNNKKSFIAGASCEDDSKISTNPDLQNKTFGLHYLAEGLREGTGESENFDIFKTQYTFKKR